MEKQVEFKIGKDTLHGTLISPKGKGSFPGVVFLHGSNSNRDNGVLAGRDLAKRGIISLAFDLRGHGKSDRKYDDITLDNYVEDGQAAIDFLIENGADPSRLGVKGSSLGGYIAANLSRSNNIKTMLLNVPAAFSDSKMTMTQSYAKGLRYLNDPNNWKKSTAYEAIKNYKGCLLVIENELDELLSSEMVRNFYHAAKNAKKREIFLMKGAKHATWDNPEALKKQHEMTIDWFSKTL